MPTLQSAAQSLSPDNIVALFTLDTSAIGGPIMRFVQGNEATGQIQYQGLTYEPVDVEFTGLETSGVGSLPTPRIRLANHDGIFQNILNTWGDVLGCPVYRIRTFARFLDGHPDADPNAFYGPDLFRVERKVAENPVYLEWELSAAVDQEGKMLPGRQVIRDTCLWRYRSWDPVAGDFDYSKAQCPYTGANYFDINDDPVVLASDDKPSRRLSCCEKRFGAGNPLPFGGFPGVARIRG